jgi:uroporphyrinogen decarboxylase
VISIGLHDHPAVLDAMATASGDLTPTETDEAGWSHGKERRWAHGGESVIRSEADFEAFPWPTPDDFDYSILDEANRIVPAHCRVILTVGKIFNLGWWLMGFDTFAYALVDNPGLIERLYERIASIQAGVVERAIEHPSVGMVWHADDMAYGSGPMVSPAFLRRAILPTYTRLNSLCRQQGLLTGFHSDGNVDVLIDDLIEAGFDSFNPVEPLAMDIRALKRRVAGRLALIGNVDLSYTLTRGSPAEVDAEVRDLIRDLGPGGGYGLASANSVPEYVPWENFVAMHSAWLKYGRYPICL